MTKLAKQNIKNNISEDVFDSIARGALTMLGRKSSSDSRVQHYKNFIADFKSKWRDFYASRKDKKQYYNEPVEPNVTESKRYLDSSLLSAQDYNKLNAVFESIVQLDKGIFAGDVEYKSKLMNMFISHYYPEIWAQMRGGNYQSYLKERDKWANYGIETLYGGLDDLIRFLFTLYERDNPAPEAQRKSSGSARFNSTAPEAASFDANAESTKIRDYLRELQKVDPQPEKNSDIYKELDRSIDILLRSIDANLKAQQSQKTQ